jgi:hypothetical protein
MAGGGGEAVNSGGRREKLERQGGHEKGNTQDGGRALKVLGAQTGETQ